MIACSVFLAKNRLFCDYSSKLAINFMLSFRSGHLIKKQRNNHFGKKKLEKPEIAGK